MAIKTNDSSAEFGRKLYTGLQNFFIRAINPSKEQIKEIMGYEPKTEPEYVSQNDNGNAKVRLDIYLENPEFKIKTKISLWLENELSVSAGGNKQWINDIGQSCYAATPDTYEWFKQKDTARHAKKGEVMLHEFLAAWANVKQGDEVKLDTMEDIFKGNIKELTDLVPVLNNNSVRVLLGVREHEGKQYQDVYTRKFGRPYRKQTDDWTKQLNSQAGQFKSNYQNSLDFKEFTGSAALVTPDAKTDGDEF